MARSVINLASSPTSEKYADVPRTMQAIPWKGAVQEQEPSIKMVSINSLRFNSNHSAILVCLKASSNLVTIMGPYKVDMGSDGNIMLFHTYKNYS